MDNNIAVFGTTGGNANEFAIEWERGRNYAGVTAPSGSALKNKILRLREEHPEDITHLVINKDGSIFAHIPVNYVKISPPRKISEEQKRIASERFQKIWKEKKKEDI